MHTFIPGGVGTQFWNNNTNAVEYVVLYHQQFIFECDEMAKIIVEFSPHESLTKIWKAHFMSIIVEEGIISARMSSKVLKRNFINRYLREWDEFRP